MAKEVKIEKGINLPPANQTSGPYNAKHPMRIMKPGQSYLTDKKDQRRIPTAYWAKKTGFEYATRKLPRDGGFVRVWRVA
jgi:hypothetical protein